MKRIFVVLAFGVLSAPLFANAQVSGQVESAEQMVSDCKPLANAKITGDEVAVPSDLRSGICFGAFLAFYRAIWYVDGSGKPLFGVCAPHHISTTQLIKVFIAYTERHHERLQDDFFRIALNASREAFPCKQ